MSSGPHCRMLGPYRYFGKRWYVGCEHCHWFAEPTFPTMALAKAYFKAHKNDAPWTYNDHVQQAYANLRAAKML